MTTPVSFEVAKLLKEKGFDKKVFYFYQDDILNQSNACFLFNHSIRGIHYTSAPTIAEVVMWLYEKHGIWIGVQPNEPYVDDDWCFTIFKDLKNNNSLEGYNSPTEAYEAAIEHTLKNLIQEEEQKTKVVNLQDKERQRIYEKILNRKME